MTAPIDPTVNLVRQAMATAVLMALEDKPGLIAKLQAVGPDGSLPDALTSDAEGFVLMRTDLIEAITGNPTVSGQLK